MDLLQALAHANLPGYKAFDRKFLFEAEHGSHFHALMGTITGISLSDEGGLKLYVSIPMFWGLPLKHLAWDEDHWVVVVADEEEDKKIRDRIAALPDDQSEETGRRAEAMTEEYLRSLRFRGTLTLL